MDETGFVVHGKNCRVWIAAGNPVNDTYRQARVHISGGRGAAAAAMGHFNYRTVYVVDGYSGYGHPEPIRRCWAHMLRESEYAAGDNRQAHTSAMHCSWYFTTPN